jgi:hypothetical protein
MQCSSIHNSKIKDTMEATLLTRRSIACPKSYGMCVAVPHGLVVVSDFNTHKLHVYSLIDGSLIRSIGSRGSGKGQFSLYYGGLCVGPDGDSVLVAESHNNRVQEVRIVNGSWVRFVGGGVLYRPEFVDCNADVIVVSHDWHCISVLLWADSSVLARFGSMGSGPGQLLWPRGVRLLDDGSGVVVADYSNHRLCVFTLSGEFVAAVGSWEQGLCHPHDVLECATDGSFIVGNYGGHDLIKLSRDSVKIKELDEYGDVDVFGKYGGGDGEFCSPTALAALPNDGCLVVDLGNWRLQYFAYLHARLAWMRACASRIV